MAPPSFAAAAGAGAGVGPGASPNMTTSRGESSEWSRRANGNTQTFRRPSLATTTANSTHQRDGSASQPRASAESAGVYVPPHANANRNGVSSEHRYTKEQLLQLFRAIDDSESTSPSLSDLFVGGWEPHVSNGPSTASWGRRDENKEGHSADLCWDRDAQMLPMALQNMTEEDRDLFSSSVNSPLKPPAPNTNKDGTPKEGASHRKLSISQTTNSPGSYGLSSPTSTRPGIRRRETSDAFPFQSPSLVSPVGASRFSRDENNNATPPPALLRRRTDLKDAILTPASEERDKDKVKNIDPISVGGLKRSTTNTLAGSTSSPWPASQSAGFSPMGAFGSFAIGTGSVQSSATAEKRPGFGSLKGESRFKGLMSKETTGESSPSVKEKGSLTNLGRFSATDQDKGVHSWMEARSNRPTSEDSDPFPHDEFRGGSAALGGGFDSSPVRPRGFTGDESTVSAFGMTTDTVGHRGGQLDDLPHGTPQHRNEAGKEPMSPTNTNPFQSPENDRHGSEDLDNDGSDIPKTHLPGLGGFLNGQSGLPGLGGFGPTGRVGAPYEASDRSQTSSTGPGRGFASLGGLGGLPGLGGASAWSAAPGSGTPTRDRAGFGNTFGEGIFSSTADYHSPVLSGLGGGGFGAAPSSSAGTIGRGSRMGSLFPTAMQEQIRKDEAGRLANEEGSFDSYEQKQPGFGSFGRSTIGSGALGASGSSREADSPFRVGRGLFDELLGAATKDMEPQSVFGDSNSNAFTSNPLGLAPHNLSSFPSQEAIGVQRGGQPPLHRQLSELNSPGGSQPPQSQIRQMVMPDRMKWIYKDPQGTTQGPWSGLEMHDWYKGGFFTPELLIKRLEDPDFEPLAQLIRRIGNSREPFLVPQIGVPHEPSATSTRAPQAPTGAPSAQPPFASSFPSFGTTLTAEQQNALERRKQEEQYLMARQKEHLAQQQQLLIKQMQISGGGHGLHQLNHHSSAHSLHSQPSFGSITSPSGYQPSPTQGPMSAGQSAAGFFDTTFRQGPATSLGPMPGGMEMLGNIREGEIPGMLERLNMSRATQAPIGGGQAPLGQLSQEAHSQQVAAMLNDRARLQREQADHDLHQRPNQSDLDVQFAQDRLQQFHSLRIHTDQPSDMQYLAGRSSGIEHSGNDLDDEVFDHVQGVLRSGGNAARVPLLTQQNQAAVRAPSLTQQVQAAASAKKASAQQTSWTKLDMSTTEPIQRPPQSASPMPAPVAQRKQNVADNLVAESRSQTQSPAAETPSAALAPWAKDTGESSKGPSLKEIQEAESKKSARQEEIAAAQRKIAFEREFALIQAAAQASPAPGLPSSSNWASTQSPVGSSISAPSVWAKPSAKSSGKTLQQIQKEEEDRKRRAAAAAASAVSVVGGVVQPNFGGKRYADITSKASPASPVMPNSPWTTVGASGKAKAPVGATPAGPSTRLVSGNVPTVQTPRPSAVRSTTLGGNQTAKMGKADALEEFKKWAVADLQRGQLSGGVDANDLVEMLLAIGSDVEVLTEAVHSSSQTIDSRHFAEEFVRRKKQADKGVVEPSSTASPSSAKSANDWSAVAKKGPPTVAPPGGAEPFKIAKRKGGRK